MTEGLDSRVYQAAFHIISEAAALVDEDGVVLSANPAFTQLIADVEAEPRRLEELFASEDQVRIGSLLREAHRWFEASLKGVKAAAGGHLPVDLHADQYVTGEGQHLLLVRARSASARLEAERLHETAAFAAHAANKADTDADLFAGIWAVLQRVLPEAQGGAWLRRTESGWRVAASRGDLQAWGEPPERNTDGIWEHFAQGGESVMIANAPLELPDEELLRVQPTINSLVLSPVVLPDGTDGLLLATAREPAVFTLEDLRCLEAATREMGSALARMRAHNALAQAHDELQASLAQKDALLERVRRLNEELAEFALWTTHDLREPLRGLAELAEILAHEAVAGHAEEVQDVATQLGAAATGLKERIRALHDFYMAARDSDVREPSELEPLVREAASDASIEGLQVDVKDELRVMADPWRVRRAIHDMFSFLSTAGAGSGTVVEIAQTSETTARVSLSVPMVMTPHGAEAAFRLVGQEGSLALARRIALQHGGALRFETGETPHLSLVLPTAPAHRAEG